MAEIKQIKVGSTTYDIRDAKERFYTALVPYGTAIPANADLNTNTYIKVGNYYCSANATVATLTNCPTTKAFMLQVYSPLATTVDNEETGTWVYRIRKMLVYNGIEYTQDVYSGATAGSFTFGPWKQTAVITGTEIPELKVRNEVNNNAGSVNTAQVKCAYITGADVTSSPGTSPTIAFAEGPSTDSAPEIIYAPQGLGVIENWNDYEIVNKKYADEHYIQSANTTTLTVVNKNASLSYGATTTIAEVAGIPISVTMPSGSSSSAPSVKSTDNTFRLIMTGVAGTTATPTTSTIVSNKLYANANSGQLTAGAFYATSDQRLKENIKDYDPKKSILDLPVVEFDFKDSGLHTIGCLAQDLQNLFPELVDTNPDGYLSIAENKLVYLCLLEIKKLRSELDELKKQCNY